MGKGLRASHRAREVRVAQRGESRGLAEPSPHRLSFSPTPEGTPRPPVETENPSAKSDTTGPWSLFRAKVVGMVEPVVSRTQEKWRKFW